MKKDDLTDLRQRINMIEGRMGTDISSAYQFSDSPFKKSSVQYEQNTTIRPLSFGINHLDAFFHAGGLATNTLHEIVGKEIRGAGTASGFAMALIVKLLHQNPGMLLWTCDPFLCREVGSLNAEGLHQFGLDPAQVLVVKPKRVEDQLWVMEEALTCQTVKVVVGEFQGRCRSLDLTATRRLALRAQSQNTMVLLLRYGAQSELSSAQTRWRVFSAPSTILDDFEPGIGRPQWLVKLDKNRDGRLGTFNLEWDYAENRFLDATLSVDMASPFTDGSDSQAEMGQAMALPRAMYG